ncbi:MAG: terpene cyclase/mutase family protein, partial [Thermoguttaceae bacterium]|nr:terpene cyclase/mutase family protein [Thermoguttaceae bacterium]
ASPVSPTSDAESAPAPSKRGFFRRRREKPAKTVEETAPVAAVAVATSQAPVDEADDLDFLRPPTFFEKAFNDAPGWLASAVVHLLLLFLLGLLVIKVDLPNPMQLVSQPGMSDEFVFDEVFDDAIENAENEEVEFETSAEDFAESENIAEITEVSDYDDPTSAPLSLADDSLTSDALAADVDSLLGSLTGDELSGRGANKAAALASGGGTEGSEKSVALALAWFAEHQRADGSWSFGHRCPCSAPGTKNSPNAATAMAVLPFLAAGHTTVEGKYKENVAAAINFLVENGKAEQAGLGFNDEGQMYAHGLATIALCESYAMLPARAQKRNRELGYAAQAAIRFIENAQTPTDGGWRYTPGQEGDTSVVGWQMMALRSGYVGSLDVSPNVLDGALHFLRDEVGFEDGSRYYYIPGQQESGATDAIGLLCRLYLDWRPDNENLLKGVDRLVAAGPNFGNPYYNYYATQLAHHVGGSRWVRWNGAIRDKLIETQVLEGHERGSWFPENADGHCQTGGRLYATALNCLVLEVYYRHLPIHQKIQSEPEFDVDFSLE